ncbi:MAG: NADH:flavin oxidoreductase [Ignavibacteria bacterium]|nr:MAG: NADH:flavin oxidoreductase [Ignavibacteria bacterium]
MGSILNTGIQVGRLALRNRLVRSATYEGAADAAGIPHDGFRDMYEQLARSGVGMMITGFTAVSEQGRAMQPRQAALHNDAGLSGFRKMTDAVHRHGGHIIAQLAHTGRQTRSALTGSRPVSCTYRPSPYFRERPRMLRHDELPEIVQEFGSAAFRAREAGFDGVQLHAAHGYLLHQFLQPEVNRMVDSRNGNSVRVPDTSLLEDIIDRIRSLCGDDFPIMVKISGETDSRRPFYPDLFDRLITVLDSKSVAAIEISYGTMDQPLNIIRGSMNPTLVLKYNPLFRTRSRLRRTFWKLLIDHYFRPRQQPFTPMYNLPYAARAKSLTDIPIITVGGARTKREMERAITDGHADLVGVSRPFLREPDFATRLFNSDNDHVSPCTNCNHCVFMCDAGEPTRCYQRTPDQHFPSEGQLS